MKLKLICCEVFLREACLILSSSPHTIDPEFTPKGSHDNPAQLRKLLQDKINSIPSSAGYDAVLLGYGICGNATAGLTAGSVPLIIPRAHDCCTILLGSRERFVECFQKNLSAEWSSAGYMERGENYLREAAVGRMLGLDKSYDEYVARYGEENAKYIWETLHPELPDSEWIFIDIPETANLGFRERFQTQAVTAGKGLKVLTGDLRLLKGLLTGAWESREFLRVPPGQTIQPVYDQDQVMTVS